jgi:hypothetical protein
MPDENFATYVQGEKERLSREREDALNRKRQADEAIAKIDREFRAINAYETAKRGDTSTRGTRTRRASSGRRGGKREEIIGLINENPAGLTRGDILERMGLKGNKSGEMSVSNALTALSKASKLARREGKYVLA